jgi:recombination DNA repair RAD52 pathway protein
LTFDQYNQLIAPIRPIRVLKDPRGNSHVSQQDVTAHLTRVFGFGNFDTELLSLELLYEEPRLTYDDMGLAKAVTYQTRWDVAYRATFRLTVKSPDGTPIASYEDGSCGIAQNLPRGDAHDNAMKSAISTAKKRCAINLGDQFGLSLYNKGQMTALVRGSLVSPPKEDQETVGDVQEGVEQQVSMGHDETELPTSDLTDEQRQTLSDTLGATEVNDGA